MTPRHTALAPVAHGGVRVVVHGRGAGGLLPERRTTDADNGHWARGRTPRPEGKGWST